MFMTMLAATRHEQKAHNTAKVKIFRCDDCGRFYPNNGQLKEHISIEHLYLVISSSQLNFRILGKSVRSSANSATRRSDDEAACVDIR